MDELYLQILHEFGINSLDNLDGVFLERDMFLDDEKYKRVGEKVNELKKYFSSSLLTSLQGKLVTRTTLQHWQPGCYRPCRHL